ncbi:hypothetical protein [Halomicrobium urmianum]|uniref:hypothetical protein n=1 Tax=Halomicrobium urmianum TaxID=1586233 RepID=UPI001CD9787E|nr:hypothetical protein [Halomicrobium urmianum]
MDDRARITVPDVAMFLGAIAMVGALYPVFAAGLEDNLGQMDQGTIYLFRLMLPLMVLVIFGLIFRKAAAGGRR